MIEHFLHKVASQRQHGVRLVSKLCRPFFSEVKMAAVASESEQVADLTNADISAEEKPADDKPDEVETKEEGALSD